MLDFIKIYNILINMKRLKNQNLLLFVGCSGSINSYQFKLAVSYGHPTCNYKAIK